MNSKPIFLTLSTDLAHELVKQLQAVLDGEASYFHVELLSDDDRPIAIHLGGSDDEPN
jgi:hypothetical protein